MPRVKIHRDEWGMPHIYAGSEEAAFYGIGYAQAEDRLEMIYKHQLMVEGRFAAVLGAEAIPVDVMARCWKHAEESIRIFESLPAQLRRNYQAFANGVDTFAEAHPDRVPDWAPSIEPWLPCAIGRAFLWGPFAISDAARVCLRAGIEPDFELVGELHWPTEGASNEWVLMPSRTATGNCMLLSDPHGDIPNAQMFEFAVEAGSLKFSGVTLVGCALAYLGFTPHIAWGNTTGGPQVSDCYRITTVENDPLTYLVDGESRSIRVEEVTIDVAGEASCTRRFEYATVNDVLAPVVARADRDAYAIATPYMHLTNSCDEQIYRWMFATTIEDCKAAMEPCAQFAQNVLIADSSGDAWYVRAGRVPVRPSHVDVSLPLDGNTSSTAWSGIHPIADLVQIENPTTGYMQNCNIAPDTMLLDTVPAELRPERYPSYIYNDRSGRTNSRGDRARELLAQSTAASVDDALAIALDVRWPGTESWKGALVEANGRQPSVLGEASQAARSMFGRLVEFDGEVRGSSVPALDFVYWRTVMGWGPGVAVDDVRRLTAAVEDGLELTDDQCAALVRAVVSASQVMRDRHGVDQLPYGEVFRVGTPEESYSAVGGAVWTHPPRLDWELEELTQTMLAPLRLFHLFSEPDEAGRRYALAGGRSLRLTVLAERVESYSVVLWGQSGDPLSSHRGDQARLASESRVRRIHFTYDELMPHIQSSIEIDVA